MASTGQNFSMYQGETINVSIPLFESDGVTPLNLTGASVTWAMSPGVFFKPPKVIKSTTDGTLTIDDPVTAGVISFTIEPDDTRLLTGQMYQEVEVVDGNGDVSVVMTGLVTINPTLNS